MGINAAVVVDLVIGAAHEAIAIAIVAVFADGVVVVKGLIEGRERIERGLNIVDAAAVVVISAIDQEAELLFFAETAAVGAARLSLRATVEYGRVATLGEEIEVGVLGRRLGLQVHRAADAVGVHIGGKRLVDLHLIDQFRGYDIEAHLAHSWFRRGQRYAVNRDIGQPGLGAAHLDVYALAFDAVERH